MEAGCCRAEWAVDLQLVGAGCMLLKEVQQVGAGCRLLLLEVGCRLASVWEQLEDASQWSFWLQLVEVVPC